MKTAVLAVQVVTYLVLGTILATEGHWKLAASQWLLAAVQGLIYS